MSPYVCVLHQSDSKHVGVWSGREKEFCDTIGCDPPIVRRFVPANGIGEVIVYQITIEQYKLIEPLL